MTAEPSLTSTNFIADSLLPLPATHIDHQHVLNHIQSRISGLMCAPASRIRESSTLSHRRFTIRYTDVLWAEKRLVDGRVFLNPRTDD